MSTLDPELLDRLRALKPELRARFGVSAIAVFGSRARGEHGAGSDLDLLLDFERTPSFFALNDLDDFLVSELGVRVDLVPRTCLHPGIKDVVLAEARAV
ncbi:nucleotidyltransferase family protein [Alkalicaulis satelles]|uniref:Nucleotidyltransferase family protein n=1 Tax=Alkalicaulis satelles TaxID=2609175 RepID=A0A5M6ZM40_9PROT|nr:nucleotidyltransferase family protein [Alkalicaulis satelles]KAA5805380.1 nucleotidyltransferase family protein [Alkalicaulis satelles]